MKTVCLMESVCISNNWISESLVFVFKFPGVSILKIVKCHGCPLFQNKTSLCQNNRATHARHNYSRWRRPGNLKVKIRDFKINYFLVQTHFSVLKELFSKLDSRYYFIRFIVIPLLLSRHYGTDCDAFWSGFYSTNHYHGNGAFRIFSLSL